MKNKRRWLYRSLCLVFLLIFLCGCQKQPANLKKDAGPEAIPVKVVIVAPQDMQELLDYVANIKAQQEVWVFPKVTGKIIEKVKEEGDSVAKAEAIAFIDRDEVGLTFAKAPVESPISGVVGKVMVDIGSNVSAQTPVALVVDMEKVKVFLDVPEKYLTKITLGMHAQVTVDAYPEQSFDGILEKINPVLDIATRTIQVEIIIDNKEHKLRSGMYAKVKLVTQEYKNTLAVFKEAVLGKEPKQYVYVVDGQKAVLKEITAGVRQGGYLQVKEGIKAGDKVVIMGQQRLYEGALVLVEENGK
jgi:membrane fusion protein, multidrug efflux system